MTDGIETELMDFFKTCKNRRYFSREYLNVLKGLMKMTKTEPDLINSMKVYDEPSHNFKKFQIYVEKNKGDRYYDKYHMVNRDFDCNIKIDMGLNNSYFDTISFLYPSKMRVFRNCRSGEIEFDPKYKIGGLFYLTQKKWIFSEFYWDKISLDNYQILSEMIFNNFTNNNNTIVEKINNNKDLVNDFTKNYKKYHREIYNIPFIFIGSEDLKQTITISAVNNPNHKYILNLLSLFEKFNETLVRI